MNPARIIDGALSVYPYTLRHLRAERPQTSWPTDWSLIDLTSVGCVAVQPVSQPALQPGESVREGSPEFVGGVWRQTWIVRAMTPEEVAAAEAAAAATAEAQQIRALVSDLRDGVGTVAQRVTRCERVLVRLIHEALGE